MSSLFDSPSIDMRYFAYGANMDRVHMSRTAPGAVLLGHASLDGYCVAIGKAGYGTLVPDAGAVTHGMLWQLTKPDEDALDDFEGIEQGFYRKDVVTVRTAAGDEQAMVYFAVDARPGVTSPDYIRQVVAAAEVAGLPADYVRGLAALPQSDSTEPWIPPGSRSAE